MTIIFTKNSNLKLNKIFNLLDEKYPFITLEARLKKHPSDENYTLTISLYEINESLILRNEFVGTSQNKVFKKALLHYKNWV